MRILIIKTSSLGDIIQTFPVISYLKHRFQDCTIDWVVEAPFKSILESHPDLQEIITIDTKKWRKKPFQKDVWEEVRGVKRRLQRENYDVAFDLQGNIKSGLLLGLAKAYSKVGFGLKTVPEFPNILFTRQRYNPSLNQNIREDYLHLVQNYFKDNHPFKSTEVELYINSAEQDFIENLVLSSGDLPKVMICPGAAWENKQLSQRSWSELLKNYHAKTQAFYYFIYGSEKEHQFVKQLGGEYPSLIVEKQRLPVLQNLMNKMDLVMAMDSLCLHLAGTTKVSTFSVFGPSSMKKYKPNGNQHLSIQGGCPYHRNFEKRCPILRTCPTGACIKQLDGETLFTALIKLVENKN